MALCFKDFARIRRTKRKKRKKQGTSDEVELFKCCQRGGCNNLGQHCLSWVDLLICKIGSSLAHICRGFEQHQVMVFSFYHRMGGKPFAHCIFNILKTCSRSPLARRISKEYNIKRFRRSFYENHRRPSISLY